MIYLKIKLMIFKKFAILLKVYNINTLCVFLFSIIEFTSKRMEN